MRRFFLIILVIIFQISFLNAAEPKFKLTFGSNLGNIPLEINKINKIDKMIKNKMSLSGIKINSWILTPNFSSFIKKKGSSNFLESKNSKDSIYLRVNLKF
jgi:hypothetical protein|tara:strand:- start:228 stop:530 length:303 start_codon:yes stop_codon:yes gene_type:complete